jgi:hypothetical protein
MIINIYKTPHTKKVMGRQLFLLVFVSLLLIGFVSAEVQSLGTFKQNQCVNVIQTCSNCTYANISSIVAPDSTEVLGLSSMTKVGTKYNKTFCSTSSIGTYIVNGYADVDGVNTVWAYDFEVTPSGYTGTLGFSFILLGILGGLIVLGFAIKEGWFVVIGGMGFMVFGLYSIINGIAGFKDTFMTWTVSLLILGIGAYLSIKSAIELIQGDLG